MSALLSAVRRFAWQLVRMLSAAVSYKGVVCCMKKKDALHEAELGRVTYLGVASILAMIGYLITNDVLFAFLVGFLMNDILRE